MNKWIEYSIAYANQRSYLDDLFEVYPTVPDGNRQVKQQIWSGIEEAFRNRDNDRLIYFLLKLDLSPVKDSYIAYLKRDKWAVERNTETVNRICERLYTMGLDEMYKRCTAPKETNRQIGPMFKAWLRKNPLGIAPVGLKEFISTRNDAVLDASDKTMMDFAREELNYTHDKGLDFVGRFNGKYVIGEAKFLTDFGGHQNAQLKDAIATIETEDVDAVKIAILDGVLYIKGRNKMYNLLTTAYSDYNIMSALVLRDFLEQL